MLFLKLYLSNNDNTFFKTHKSPICHIADIVNMICFLIGSIFKVFVDCTLNFPHIEKSLLTLI